MYHATMESSRRLERTRVLMTGALVGRDGTQRVTIRDVSKGGAQVAGRDRILRGCDVLLTRGPLFAAAHVVWSKGTEAGLKFYRELSADEMERAFPDVVIAEAL